MTAFTASNDLSIIKANIAYLMLEKGYVLTDLNQDQLNRINLYNIQYFIPRSRSMTFQHVLLTVNTRVSRFDKLKEQITGRTKELRTLNQTEFFKSLRNMMETVPAFIQFSFSSLTYKVENETKIGTSIEILSTPVVLAKVDRKMMKSKIDENDYTNIIVYNNNFLETLAKDIGMQITDGPRVKVQPAKLPELFDEKFLDSLAEDVAQFFSEANGCYKGNLVRASAAMIRAGIEAVINEKFKKLGREKELYDNEGEPKQLSSKLNLVAIIQGMKKDTEAIEDVKWMGDKALHSLDFKIEMKDIDSITILKVKNFVDKLNKVGLKM